MVMVENDKVPVQGSSSLTCSKPMQQHCAKSCNAGRPKERRRDDWKRISTNYSQTFI